MQSHVIENSIILPNADLRIALDAVGISSLIANVCVEIVQLAIAESFTVSFHLRICKTHENIRMCMEAAL